MSAIVEAMDAFTGYLPDRCAQCWYPKSLHMDRSHKASEHRFVQDLAPRFIESTLIAAGRAIVDASNAACRAANRPARVTTESSGGNHAAIRYVSSRPCAWPRPFARGV